MLIYYGEFMMFRYGNEVLKYRIGSVCAFIGGIILFTGGIPLVGLPLPTIFCSIIYLLGIVLWVEGNRIAREQNEKRKNDEEE